MRRRPRVALIGAGVQGQTVHLPALSLVAELELVGIATSREETAAPIAAQHRVDGFVGYTEVVNREDIDAVILATPPAVLPMAARAALECGKHVFLETPGVENVEQARELASLAQQNELIVQVGYLLRYAESFDLLRSHANRSDAPRLFSYDYYGYLHHMYNLACYISGPVDRVLAAVSCSAGMMTMIRFTNRDIAVIIGRAIANSSVDTETVRVSTEDLFAEVDGRRRFRAFERMRPTEVHDWSIASARGVTFEPQVFAARFLESCGPAPQLRAFADAIETGRQPRSTLDDAAETQQLQALVNESAGRGSNGQQA